MTPARIAALFDGPVGIGITDPRCPSGVLFPAESAAIAQAITKRQTEFAAGRAAARTALRAIGGPSVALPPGADRLPDWPAGYAGSISHCADLCLAVAAQDVRAIGVDVEPAQDLPTDLWDEILLPQERVAVAATKAPGLMARLIFCMKEAAYKAQFPASRTLYGFHDMSLQWDATSFQAEFRIPAGPFRPGDRLLGRYLIDSSHIVAAVTLA